MVPVWVVHRALRRRPDRADPPGLFDLQFWWSSRESNRRHSRAPHLRDTGL